ncbi:Phosphofructokinase [Candidatus Kryptonium thompsonii]|nr:Phosphofructokinase [Candidatus Kryptonium thompsoni]
MTKEGRAKAAKNLKEQGIEALVAIGGDGTFRGAVALYEEHGIPSVGIPATIDNDLYGTDYTIGYDTAVNTALESIDKIRDTADAHDRLFYVEVMGRTSGFIAVEAGIGGGAEYIAIPEEQTDYEEIRNVLKGFRKDKTSSIIIVAEGDEEGGAFKIAKKSERTLWI